MPGQGRGGAVADLRVVDLSHYLAGPTVAMVLGDLGADVVRVDPPGGPLWGHPSNAIVQRDKRSIVLDLHDEEGRALTRRLIARADGVVASFRPGVADRLGIVEAVDVDAGEHELAVALEAVFAEGTAAQWVDRLVAAGVPAQVVLSIDEARDEHARARGLGRRRTLLDGG